MAQLANFLNEVGMLNRTPRSGFQFLGTAKQSVAEHSFRMLHVAFVLARMNDERVDELRLLHLVMFHDLPEARTGDHNYVNRRYVQEDMDALLSETERAWADGKEIAAYIREFEQGETRAARLAKDADQIELLLVLKEQLDLGNADATDWIQAAVARIKTEPGRKLAEEILATRWNEWWFSDKNDSHWVEGKKHGTRR